jgi:hypothetical protein
MQSAAAETSSIADHAAHQQRSAFIRDIGTGFGSLAGASLLFLSVLANQLKHDLATKMAIICFAVALPLLAFTTVAAFSLAQITAKPSIAFRRAIGTTTFFGLFGAMGVIAGIALLLWRLDHFAAVTFAGCAVVALITYLAFARQVASAHKRARPEVPIA